MGSHRMPCAVTGIAPVVVVAAAAAAVALAVAAPAAGALLTINVQESGGPRPHH